MVNTIKKKTADRIEKILNENGYNTVEKQAEYLSLNNIEYIRYITGEDEMPIDVIRKLCNSFFCPADYILGLSDVRTPDENMKFICETLFIDNDKLNFLLSCGTKYKTKISVEKFYKTIEQNIDFISGLDEPLKTTLLIAVNSAEYQIPRKVINDEYDMCPCCGEPMSEHYSYCPYCGQALEWKVESGEWRVES